MALFPIMSNFERDFVVQLVPVDTEDTMDQLRVRKHETGELLPRDMKVSEAGLRPTETLDILFMDS